MSFTMTVFQYFPLVTTVWGPQMALPTAPRALIWPEAVEAAAICFLTPKEWSVAADILHHFLVLLSLRKNLPLYLLR